MTMSMAAPCSPYRYSPSRGEIPARSFHRYYKKLHATLILSEVPHDNNDTRTVQKLDRRQITLEGGHLKRPTAWLI